MVYYDWFKVFVLLDDIFYFVFDDEELWIYLDVDEDVDYFYDEGKYLDLDLVDE